MKIGNETIAEALIVNRRDEQLIKLISYISQPDYEMLNILSDTPVWIRPFWGDERNNLKDVRKYALKRFKDDGFTFTYVIKSQNTGYCNNLFNSEIVNEVFGETKEIKYTIDGTFILYDTVDSNFKPVTIGRTIYVNRPLSKNPFFSENCKTIIFDNCLPDSEEIKDERFIEYYAVLHRLINCIFYVVRGYAIH